MPEAWASRWLRGAMDLGGVRAVDLECETGISDHQIRRIVKGLVQPKVAQLIELIEGCGCEVLELRVKKP